MRNILLLFMVFASLPASASELEPIVLARGMSEQLTAGHGSIYLANGGVAVAREIGGHLIVTGKAKGRTTLRVGSKTFSVIVIEKPLYLTFEALHRVVKKFMGLRVRVDEDAVSIQGELLRFSDWIQLRDLIRLHQAHFRFEAKMNAEVESEAATYFRSLLLKNQLPLPNLTFTPRAHLAVPTGEKDLIKEYRSLLEPFGFVLSENSKAVSLEPMVEVEILVAEVRRNFARKIGVQYPTAIQAQVLPQVGAPVGVTGGQASADGGIDLMLHMMEQNGTGRILAAPKLLCRSGKDAQFLAGGEFPIKIVNFKINDVVWKRYGVLLHIKPLADLSGRMSIGIETEVSMIDQAHAVDGIPGMLTNRVSSHFDLDRPQTIALSGLIKSEIGRSTEGLPFLQRIPILGLLFSSEDFKENRSELVVFVTPRVVAQENINQSIKMPSGWSDDL